MSNIYPISINSLSFQHFYRGANGVNKDLIQVDLITGKTFLDSWKEISDYLERSEKTCRKWEKEFGLPIHRLEDSPKARVFAYREELDKWIREKLSVIGNDKSKKIASSALRKSKIPKQWLVIGITILTIATLLAIFLLYKSEESGLQLTGRVISLTASPGLEDKPSWSPDGKHIAYMSDKNGNFDIYIMNVETREELNLTWNHTGDDINPEWSPDGNRIAYYSDREGGGIFHTSNIGGTPVLIINFATTVFVKFNIHMSWSPDGSNLVYTNGRRLLSIISLKGEKPKKIQLPSNTKSKQPVTNPIWSPDGRRIAFTETHDFSKLNSTIWILNQDGSNPIKITDSNFFSDNPVWSSDGLRLFFISNMGGGSNDIWWVALESEGKPSGSPKCLMPGVNVSAIALSPDGTRLVFSKVISSSNIWSIPIVDNYTFTLGEAEQETFENYFIHSLDISPDGKWIAFSSNRKGNQDIWIMNKQTKKLRQLTTSEATDTAPDWSPDGKNIVFTSDRSGNKDIFRIPVEGGMVIQLTSYKRFDDDPNWSPNGDEIAFCSSRTPKIATNCIMPSSGGDPRILVPGISGISPIWSPDGERIAFASVGPLGKQQVFYVFSKGGKPVQLTNSVVKRSLIPLYWSSDGRNIYAFANKDNLKNFDLWIISFPEGSIKPLLTGIGGSKKLKFTLSSDGEHIYFVVCETIGDLLMAELTEIN